ncbi:diguanylate cyclase domain-containing protein, partial [Deinococcus aquaticus]|uniref:GGDEF domain-containing protein n=1 Tax=Deinococcus aquaticus TaxID=328692 RepID=UPI003F469D54
MMWHDVLTLLSGLGVALVGAVLLSADLRHWPPRAGHPRMLVRTLLAGATGVILMLYSLPLLPGVFVDLRYLPSVLFTLLFGPGWGALALLPVLTVRVLTGGAGVGPAVISAGAALVISGLIFWRVGPRLFTQPRRWALLPLIFVFNGVGLLLQPDGAALFQRVYGPLMLVNVLALWAAMLVVHRRARHLQSLLDLRRAAFMDPLTGLNNRRQFDLDLKKLQAGQHLVALDVDFFKQVNDRLGHAGGDRVLREVAQALGRSVRPQDSVYRVGGEEFALILRDLTPEQGLMVTQRCLNAAPQIDGGGQPVTLSAGWTAAQPGEPGESALARADAALYRAKDAGRNRMDIDPGTDQTQAVALAARRTLALLASDHDPDAADWLALLQAAVQDVPGAQSGTLYVLDRGDFLLSAQTGFSDDLLGQRRSPASLLRWYAGPPGDWQAGAPRVLRGEAIRVNTHAASEVEAQVTGQEHFRHLSVDGIHESLGVPVAVDGLVMAFLNLDRVAPGPPFGPEAQ